MKRMPYSVEEGEEAEEVLFVPLNQRVSQSLQLCLYFCPNFFSSFGLFYGSIITN